MRGVLFSMIRAPNICSPPGRSLPLLLQFPKVPACFLHFCILRPNIPLTLIPVPVLSLFFVFWRSCSYQCSYLSFTSFFHFIFLFIKYIFMYVCVYILYVNNKYREVIILIMLFPFFPFGQSGPESTDRTATTPTPTTGERKSSRLRKSI